MATETEDGGLKQTMIWLGAMVAAMAVLSYFYI